MQQTKKRTIALPSALFPFYGKDLMKFDYGGYRLQNVFQSINEEQIGACVDLWLRNRVLPSEEAARQRSAEVCYFITDRKSSKLIGVNTLYPDTLPGTKHPVFMNRMFIDPTYRNSRLMIVGTAMMLVFAKTHLEHNLQLGVANLNENGKLSRPGMNRIFDRLGYRRLGFVSGQELLFFEFKRIQFREAREPNV